MRAGKFLVRALGWRIWLWFGIYCGGGIGYLFFSRFVASRVLECFTFVLMCNLTGRDVI